MPDPTPLETMLASTKLSLRVSTTSFDSEITDLINAGLADLGLAGVTDDDMSDPLIKRAVITYVELHFGEPDQYDRLKASYDEQKAQLSMATGYTTWTEATS